MKKLKIEFASCAACLLALASQSLAGGNFEWIGDGVAPTDVSADGSVIAGNIIGDNSYETFRWTQATGVVRLGRATVPVIGTGAGSPDISHDGTVISATILDQTEMFQTMGRWVEGQGWDILVPPTGPDGTTCDNGISSAWGLSGDGSTVVGFYWASCKAHPCKYDTTDGLIPLPWQTGVSARVNASNIDGSIVGGWSSSPTGGWQPTIWRDGAMTVISPSPILSMVEALSDNGDVVVGQYWNPSALDRVDASMWHWNGTSYDQTYINALPGTPLGSGGRITAADVSGDGSIVVGTNYYFWNGPFSSGTGFVWSQAIGTVDVLDILDGIGHPLPANMQIAALTAISQDGSTIVGIAQDTTTFQYRGFRLTLTPTGCEGDADGNQAVDVNDISFVVFRLGNSGAACLDGDVDGNGSVDVNDISFTIFRLGTCDAPVSCP